MLQEPFLPAPMKTIDDINRSMAAQQRAANLGVPAGGTLDAEMEIDIDEDRAKAAGQPAAQQSQLKAELSAIGISADVIAQTARDSAAETAAALTESALPQPTAAAMTTTAAAAAANELRAQRALKVQLCPICKQEIPLDQIQEHMRIELLDPKWKEQKIASLVKQRESNIAADQIAANLARLAKRKAQAYGYSASDDKDSDQRSGDSQLPDFQQLMARQAASAAATAETAAASTTAPVAAARPLPLPAPVVSLPQFSRPAPIVPPPTIVPPAASVFPAMPAPMMPPPPFPAAGLLPPGVPSMFVPPVGVMPPPSAVQLADRQGKISISVDFESVFVYRASCFCVCDCSHLHLQQHIHLHRLVHRRRLLSVPVSKKNCFPKISSCLKHELLANCRSPCVFWFPKIKRANIHCRGNHCPWICN